MPLAVLSHTRALLPSLPAHSEFKPLIQSLLWTLTHLFRPLLPLWQSINLSRWCWPFNTAHNHVHTTQLHTHAHSTQSPTHWRLWDVCWVIVNYTIMYHLKNTPRKSVVSGDNDGASFIVRGKSLTSSFLAVKPLALGGTMIIIIWQFC